MKDIEIRDYRYHPRVLEVRLVSIRELFTRHYGEERSMNMLKTFARSFGVSWNVIAPVFTNTADVKRGNGSRINKVTWKQEVLFAGAAFEETRAFIGDKYLMMKGNYVYQLPEVHDYTVFANDNWLDNLDERVTKLRLPRDIKEAELFVDEFQSIATMVR